MKTSLLVKINFLVLGLGLTVYFIYQLNTGGLGPTAQQLLGLQTSANVGTNGSANLNWCDSRVAAIIRPNEFKISQEGDSWIQENGEQHKLDVTAFENWLEKFCSVKTAVVETAADQSFVPALIVKFITGEVEVIRQNTAGLFSWKGKTYAAPEFEAGLKELPQLPKQ